MRISLCNVYSLLVLIMIFILIYSGSVLANRPLDTKEYTSRADPIKVKDPQISWVAYTSLTEEDEVDYYQLSVGKGEQIYASMSIPQLDRLINYDPVIALIGPQLDDHLSGFNKNDIYELLDIKTGEGVIVKRYEGSNLKKFFEPFTQTKYWEKQELRVGAPSKGIYYLAVFSLKDQIGKYVFSIGEKEKWGLKDMARFPKIWWEVRKFMEKTISTYVIVVFIGLIIVILVLKIIL